MHESGGRRFSRTPTGTMCSTKTYQYQLPLETWIRAGAMNYVHGIMGPGGYMVQAALVGLTIVHEKLVGASPECQASCSVFESQGPK